MKRLTRKEGIVILKSFLETRLPRLGWYQEVRQHVKAIVFYGSTAKGTNKADSDLDILIFLPLKIERKYTKGEYIYGSDGRVVNIVIRSIERLRELGIEHDDASQAEVFRRCCILYEPDTDVRALIKKMMAAKV